MSLSDFGQIQLPTFLFLIHAILGALIALLLLACFDVGRWLLRRIGVQMTLSRAAASVLGAAALGGLFVLYMVEERGLELHALPWGWVSRGLLFLVVQQTLARWLVRRSRPVIVSSMASSFVVAAAAVGCMVAAPVGGPGTDRVIDGTVSSGLAVKLARRAADSDGDGFPTSFCGSDCDCDDTTASIGPISFEIPDNGIDEDCDGEDYSLANVDADVIATFAAPTFAYAAAPPGAEPGPREPAPPKTTETTWRRPYNIVFILADTLRADHMGCLGYKRDTTPRLDEWAKRSVLFSQARSQGPRTPDSVPSMITGLYHAELHREENAFPRIFDKNVTAAEMLKAADYRTWAISSFIYFTPENGFAQGFDTFDMELHTIRHHIRWKPTSDAVTDRTLKQIDRWQADPGKPFFVLAHYADPHHGYNRHEISPDFGEDKKDSYDMELFFMDHHIGRLLDGLKERGLDRDTVVVFTSDHGEALSKAEDHGFEGHGQCLYDDQIHVPLIIGGPMVKRPQRIDRPVGTIDIVPTLLELTGTKHDGVLSGLSLVPYLLGDNPERPPAFSQKTWPRYLNWVTMVEWPYKAHWRIARKRFELYDLRTDPHERNDLAKKQPELLAPLAEKMRYWRAEVLRPVASIKTNRKPRKRKRNRKRRRRR